MGKVGLSSPKLYIMMQHSVLVLLHVVIPDEKLHHQIDGYQCKGLGSKTVLL